MTVSAGHENTRVSKCLLIETLLGPVQREHSTLLWPEPQSKREERTHRSFTPSNYSFSSPTARMKQSIAVRLMGSI